MTYTKNLYTFDQDLEDDDDENISWEDEIYND